MVLWTSPYLNMLCTSSEETWYTKIPTNSRMMFNYCTQFTSRNCSKIVIQPQMGTRVHGSTLYKPYDISTINDVIWAYQQWRQKVRKKVDIGRGRVGGRGDNFTYTGTCPAKRTKTKFRLRGCVAAVIICCKFYRNRLRGFRAARGQKWGSSIDFDRRPYNRSALPCCLWCWYKQ